jgi:CheY-like chemotaxis protein
MFTQLPRSAEREREGLGIGLTLVRQLVDRHGGSVRVHSEGPGQGSEFVVTLPVLVAETTPEARAEVPAPMVAPSSRVLIVDDNRDAADSLAMLVEHGGHAAFVAYDGAGALEAAERERPDIVLLDIGLPQMTGHDVCREIRKAPWGRTMRVVALTGWGQEDDRRKSREAGFDAHLVKPVDFAKLLEMLAEGTSSPPRAPSTNI